MHQQDAYIAEKGEVGDATAIGYDTPTSSVFDYAVAVASAKGTWTATPKANAISDCADSDDKWSVGAEVDGGKGKYTPSLPKTDKCKILTPNFSHIGGN